MDSAEIANFLAWCTVFNYILLTVWFAVFITSQDWIYRIHCQWFDLSKQHFEVIHYCGLALYKMLIFMFNLVPYLAMRIII